MGQILAVQCHSSARLDGKIAVITGANTGIGKTTAKDFYKRGARVILACRDVTRANEAIKDIKDQCEGEENLGELVCVKLDLSSLSSVRNCSEELLKSEKCINILVNNAGIAGVPYKKTTDGFEMTFQTNYLGHFLFTLLLMPLLIKGRPARIVNVTSMLHAFMWSSFDLSDLNFENRKYGDMRAYMESKLCNILFTKELTRKLSENDIDGITVYAPHPGAVRTEGGRYLDESYFRGMYWLWLHVLGLFYKSPELGAQTTIYCSVDEQCANETGLYYSECKPTEPSAYAKDEKLAKDLWNLSLKYVNLENYNPFQKL
ncbi:retinol dehydrogenase 13-like [Diorhabda sublineata]|uniref:retinol dehydrogenase 13-like n=1 Tax=Diorhabda sublineata TaxID=1163346 RepID=UPI0024E05AC7|nr:retinol dehydrogenase 13-like [Diorhabda sublineata]